MKLGTLLAAGKSLALRRRGESPYRANKQFYLPKFGSPKNPFASANQPGEAISPEEAAAAPVKTPITVVAAKTQKLPTFSPAPRAANHRSTTVKKPALPAQKPRRSVKWMSRLNPFASGSTFLVARGENAKIPVQTELSLDAVKVLRNDLSDVDVEVVPLKSRTSGGAGEPGREPAKKTWGLLGERFLKMKAS
ncbi:MAG: hypothetical protein ABSD57_03995 [Verrucomicrobiota bacterium]